MTRRAEVLGLTVLLALPAVAEATHYWDADGSAAGNNVASGAGLGGAGTWGPATNWFNGSSETTWSAGGDAVFMGTAGVVTLASPQSAASLSFKSAGYTVTGSTVTLGPSPANYNVDAGMTATIASVIAGGATMTKVGAGTLVLTNTANINTANSTEGGWRIDGGTLRVSNDGNFGIAPGTNVTDLQINQSTLQFGASGEYDINRRTKINTNSSANGEAVFDVNEFNISWFGSLQGGLGTLRVTDSNNNGGMLILGTDKKANINPFGVALPAGTVNLTVENHVVVQTAGTVTPDNGELGAETNTNGDALAVKLQGGGQIRSESGGYTFKRNLILGPGGGSLDTGAWLQTWLGTVSGVGSLAKYGGSTLVIDNLSATWTGGTFIHQGTIELGRAGSNGLLPGTLATPSSVVIDAGANLRFNRGSSKTFFDVISGGGNLEVANANNAVVRLVSDNTYSGLTTISSGRLMIGQGNPGEPGSIVSNVVDNAELIFNRVENLSYAGAISGTGIVTKMAAGKVTLSGASTYNGGTNVNAGALIAANTTGSATGSGPVHVLTGATIGGTGTFGGAVTLDAGAHLAPGASAGPLTVTSLVLAASSILDYELVTPATSDITIISAVGGLTLSGGTVNITALSGFGAGQYRLLDYAGSFTGAASNLALGAVPPGFSFSFVNNASATSIDVVVSVPEPLTPMVSALALTPILLRRRRRGVARLDSVIPIPQRYTPATPQ